MGSARRWAWALALAIAPADRSEAVTITPRCARPRAWVPIPQETSRTMLVKPGLLGPAPIFFLAGAADGDQLHLGGARIAAQLSRDAVVIPARPADVTQDDIGTPSGPLYVTAT